MPRRTYQKRSRTTVEGFRPTANPEQARWIRELGRSSAAQPHVPIPRKGSRRARQDAAIREQRFDREG